MSEVPASQAPPKLYICGLGQRPPYTTSLEVLHALSGCGVIVSHDPDAPTRRLLDEFCPGVRRAPYSPAAEPLFKELAAGRSAGFVTRGHPLLFGGPARGLVRRCRREGIECVVFGAVSAVDVALARLSQTLGIDIGAVQAYDSASVPGLKSLDIRQPLIVSCGPGSGKSSAAGGLLRALRRFYGPDGVCWVLGQGRHRAPWKLPLKDIAPGPRGVASGAILYFPARRVEG